MQRQDRGALGATSSLRVATETAVPGHTAGDRQATAGSGYAGCTDGFCEEAQTKWSGSGVGQKVDNVENVHLDAKNS